MIGLMHTSLYRLQILKKRLSPFNLIKHFRIRYKLLIIYSICFLITISMAVSIIYFIMKQNLEENIEAQLNNSTQAILNTVKTVVSVSIKTRLRAMAEKNTDIVHHLHTQYLEGKIPLETAQAMAVDTLLCQGIGATGYVCILTGQGQVLHHPKPPLEGRDISHHPFIKTMVGRKQGYVEYQWQNPDDTAPRPKALYFKYVKPWDWMIIAAAYREEFSKLVDINDFKEGILELKFGKTGYSYVMDLQGNVIIHPRLSGINVFTDSRYPAPLFKQMQEMKTGKLIYPWQLPGESRIREKLIRFSFIPEYQWIVGSSSYLDEYYAPLTAIKKVILIAGILALIVFIPISFFLSATITKPIRSLTERFNRDIGDGFSNHFLKMESRDEVGQLTFYYNSFMDKLAAYDRDLKAEIKERRQIQEALTESEEKYRSVMEAVPDPIVVYDMDGLVTYMNPAFTQVFGYTLQECFGQRMDHFIPRAHWKESMESIDSILQGSVLPPMETQRKAKDGRLIDVTTRGSVYRNKLGRPMGSVITHRDISEVKQLEKAIMETGERERQAIGNDLHDDLCPHLIGVEGLTKVLKKKMDHGDEQTAMADHITALIQEAISKTRRLARGLSPVYFNHGLTAALKELVDTTQWVHGVLCQLDIQCTLPQEDQMETVNLYHIAGEAVRNAVRHGRATEIRITARRTSRDFYLTVVDNGKGMNPQKETRGMGLRIMNYRAKIMGGSLGVDSKPEKGTRVTLTLPVNAPRLNFNGI